MENHDGRCGDAAGLGGPEGPAPDKLSRPDGAIPNALRFDNAKFMRVAVRLGKLAGERVERLTYGAWNPRFCAADGSADALRFFAELRAEIDYWAGQASAASAIEARRAETVQQGSVHESAVAESEAPQND